MTNRPEKRIVIIGGGFAGVKCAETLRKKLKKEEVQIVLFNRENYLVFQPLLAEVVGASISHESVSVPLRQILPDVYCRTEDITHIDMGNNYVEYSGDRSRIGRMDYDHLVIASGSDVNMGQIPGMADHAYPLKTVGDAIALRSHIIQQMENAEISDDKARRPWYLSFVVVGGGFSGVEVAGEINDLIKDTHRFYRNISKDDMKVTLVHSREQILPEVSSSLRDFARARMEKQGVKMVLGQRVAYVTKEGVGLKDDTFISGATVVSTVGNAPVKVVDSLEAEKDRGRLVTEPDMRLKGRSNVWGIGDCAVIINGYDNNTSPTTGQFAERQGRQAAYNIVRTMQGEETKQFHYKPLGQLCAIGGKNAVAEFLGMRISGFLAWFLWRTVYMSKLPKLSHKIKVGFDWAWEIFYARDLSHARIIQTERISRSHLIAGDYVFRKGDPSNNFYIIEEGEVEVLKNSGEEGEETVTARLGKGDFFGEMALLEHRKRSSSVRAKTNVELTVVGRKVFEQISGTLAPFKDFLAEAIKRRSENIWQKIPAAFDILEGLSLSIFIRPLSVTLSPRNTFEEAVKLLGGEELDFCCVVDQSNKLLGVITRTDIFRAVEHGVRPHEKVSEFMTSSPVVVSENDQPPLVAATMREHNLKWVPVVDNLSNLFVKGYVRRDKMISYVLERIHRHQESLAAD